MPINPPAKPKPTQELQTLINKQRQRIARVFVFAGAVLMLVNAPGDNPWPIVIGLGVFAAGLYTV